MRDKINDLDDKLKNYINIKNSYLFFIIAAILVVTLFTTSYAMVTASVERTGAETIVTGNLYSIVESVDFNEDNEIIIPANDTVSTEIRLSNINTRSAKLNLYYKATNDRIHAFYDGKVPPGLEGKVFPAYTDIGGYEVYNVELINPTKDDVKVSFFTDVGLDNADLILPNEVKVLSQKTCLYNGLITKSTEENYFVMTNTGLAASNTLIGINDIVIPCELNGEKVTAIADNAFYNLGLSSITIPDGVTTIGNNAFSGNLLSHMNIPDSVVNIGNNVFSNNSNLLNINVYNKKNINSFNYLGVSWNGNSNLIFK